MVGFLAVQSKARILFINLPYFPKGEGGGLKEGLVLLLLIRYGDENVAKP